METGLSPKEGVGLSGEQALISLLCDTEIVLETSNGGCIGN